MRHAWGMKPPTGCRIDSGHPLGRGLIACWTFSERAGAQLFDSVTPFGHAVMSNGPTWVPGGAEFNGSNQYATLTAPNGQIQRPTTEITIIVRVWWNAFASDSNSHGIMHWSNGSVSGGFAFYKGTTEPYNKTRFFIRTVDNTINPFDSVSLLNAGQWYHVAFTYRTGDYVRQYIDGVFDTNSTDVHSGNINYTTITDPFEMGRGFDSTYHQGRIGGAWIYSRCLSAREVMLHRVDPYSMFVPPRRTAGKRSGSPFFFQRYVASRGRAA